MSMLTQERSVVKLGRAGQAELAGKREARPMVNQNMTLVMGER
jgi:hypothetical protein